MSIDYSDMAFPKPVRKPKATRWKKQRTRSKKRRTKKYKKVPSIMQHKDDKRCFLCMLLENDHRNHSYTEEHHVLYGSRKWISDAYGLRVNLCRKHHRQDNEALHDNHEYSELLKQEAQKAFIEAYPALDWMAIVGKNYLEVEDETTEETEAGI